MNSVDDPMVYGNLVASFRLRNRLAARNDHAVSSVVAAVEQDYPAKWASALDDARVVRWAKS